MSRASFHVVVCLVLLIVLSTTPLPASTFGASLAQTPSAPLVTQIAPPRIARHGITGPAADAVPIVSRLTWGSPDGEGSPAWIPAYQDPFHIIIHHTAGPIDANGARDVLDVWSGHALGQGWGDIGYNYLIDSHGTVYEGRAGGPTVVGGHTKDYNYGSIGIALIGDYDIEKPSHAMVNSLIRLVTQLSDQFGIDVRGVTDDGTLTYPNLAGHRDFNPTSCPGTNVYRLLPALRASVARAVHSGAALVGTGWLDVGVGTRAVALLQVQNTGTTTWNGRFSLRLIAGSLPGLPKSYNLPDVPPGGTITIPLFLPRVSVAGQLNSTWQLYDASGFAAGPSFPITLDTTAAQPTASALSAANLGSHVTPLPDRPAPAWTEPAPSLLAVQARRPAGADHAKQATNQLPDPLDSVSGTARRWYFAEGSSAPRDREILAFLNPGAQPAYIVTTLVRADGRRVYAVTNVPPHGRGTLDASDAAGLGDGLAAMVESSEPIYAARTVYHGSAVDEGTGAASSPGLIEPAPGWYVPALDVVGGESERLSILNPGSVPITVRVKLAVNGSLHDYRRITLPALSLRTLDLPHGAASAEVLQVGKGAGVVVEEHRAYQGGAGYTAASGLSSPTTSGYLLAPAAGGGNDAVLLLNPGPQSTDVTLIGKDARLRTVWTHTIRLAPGRQARVLLPRHDGSWSVLRFRADQPVAASYTGMLSPSTEKVLAKKYRGSESAAFSQPSLVHSYAEGDTRSLLSAPDETLYLANPTAGAAAVSLSLLGTDGRRLSQSLTLAPHASGTIDLNDWAPPGQHGIVVLADRPILAAQSIDFNEGAYRIFSAGIQGP